MSEWALVRLAVVGAAVALGVGVATASPSPRTTAPRHAALAEAQRLLADIALPRGVQRVSGEPAGDAHQLSVPLLGAWFAAEVDQRRFWTTPASPDQVLALFHSHVPAGAKLVIADSGGNGAGAGYALRREGPLLIGPEHLILSAVTLRNGLTGIRADAQVRYLSPRLPFQRIPSTARLVQITKQQADRKPRLSLVVTSQRKVRRLGQWVDALPFVRLRTGASSCPGFSGATATDTFTFRAKAGGPALARVSEFADTPTSPSPCALTTLTIRGHHVGALLDGGVLLRRASRLLGKRLTV
jgi:hypothetical protein